MAILIPTTLAMQDPTPGERKTYQTMKKLDHTWHVWYNSPLKGTVHPDFVLLHPEYGLFILEVKDWTIHSITEVDSYRFVLSNGEEHKNPIEQARNYIWPIVNHKKYIQRIPYSFGVVFPNINRSELNKKHSNNLCIADILGAHLIISKDELLDFNESLLTRMMEVSPLKKRLTSFEEDTLRLIINPSTALPHKIVKDSESGTEREAVLSLEQERAAKSIGEGHRLLKGVAGSGKTFVLLNRAIENSAMHPDWKILFVCWGLSLSEYLRQLYEKITDKKIDQNIEIINFSKWLGKLTELASQQGILLRKNNREDILIDKLLTNKQVTEKYQVILIDEGQDFEEDYYRLLLYYLDPEVNSMMISYDYAQNIRRREISWKSLGIKVQGRSLILKDFNDKLEVNYRNTREITHFAEGIYEKKVPTKNMDDEISIIPISEKQRNKESGPFPEVGLFLNRHNEMERVNHWIKCQIEEHHVPLRQILILYSSRSNELTGFNLEDQFINKLKIPYEWITEDRAAKTSFNINDDSIKISTIMSAKGMDFEAVAVVGNDVILNEYDTKAYLYVAATRARRYLLMTTGGQNKNVESILNNAKKTKK
jgi:superfamily I DNA and RNA helicase